MRWLMPNGLELAGQLRYQARLEGVYAEIQGIFELTLLDGSA